MRKERDNPGRVREVSVSYLILTKALLKVDTVSTINCTDEKTKVETWGKRPKLTWPESCWDENVTSCEIHTPEDFFFPFFPPAFFPAVL